MQNFDSSHRKVNPARESVGSDYYTVLRYDPLTQTCDLAPCSINQRGILKEVPVSTGFGGAWEFQQVHRPKLAGGVLPEKWGNCARGPRWGTNYPIQPGDLCRVMYAGESMSDPVIAEFYRGPGNYGIPWAANQILSKQNDYTSATPTDDDEPSDRYDVLLPSGAWLRSTQSGSWVIATTPVDRAKAFIVLNADGTIKLKSRGKSDYSIHLEFDANKEEGRICVGPLEGGSCIEFKDGDVRIKAKRNILMQGQRVDGDLKPQHTPAIDSLTKLETGAANFTTSSQLTNLVAQAAGEMVLNGALTPVAVKPGVIVVKPLQKDLVSNLLANPSLDGALRGRIGDILSNPQGLLNEVVNGFTANMSTGAIASQLTGLLGANALTGTLGAITSQLDFGNLPFAKELGIPTWIGQALNGQALNLNSLLDRVPELVGLGDNELLSEVMKHVGDFAMGGASAPDAMGLLSGALNQLPGDLKNRIQGLIENIDSTPVKTPKNGAGDTDWLNTGAQRLGAHIIKGGSMLGGKANLFGNLTQQFGGKLGVDSLQSLQQTATQIESYFANPHSLVENLPETFMPYLNQVKQIPAELRDVLSKMQPSEIAQFPSMIQTVLNSALPNVDLGVLSQAVQTFNLENLENVVNGADLVGTHGGLSPLGFANEYLSNLIANLPKEVQSLLQALPEKLFTELSNLLPEQISGLLANPVAALVDNEAIRQVFGSDFSPGAGVFDIRVSRLAKFNSIPKPAGPLEGLGLTDEFHLQTFGFPVERTTEYGSLNLPDYWS